jgi:hypothetical protein
VSIWRGLPSSARDWTSWCYCYFQSNGKWSSLDKFQKNCNGFECNRKLYLQFISVQSNDGISIKGHEEWLTIPNEQEMIPFRPKIEAEIKATMRWGWWLGQRGCWININSSQVIFGFLLQRYFRLCFTVFLLWQHL